MKKGKNTVVKNGVLEAKKLSFCFYEAMGYPLPRAKDFFIYAPNQKKNSSSRKNKKSDQSSYISYDSINPVVTLFLEKAVKYRNIYSQLPFIKDIFLCNSISFNAVNEDSDIDLFVVTNKGRIRTARLLMSLVFRAKGIKRSSKISKGRFCLSFFVDEEHCNLHDQLLGERDIYLPYWIAHLVPLYQEQKNNRFFESNAWIQYFLPYFPLRHTVVLGNEVVYGRGVIKSLLEKILGGKFGDWVEDGIKNIWQKYIFKKIEKKPDLHQGVIIGNGVLKFYHDQRKKYSDIFFGQGKCN